MSDPWTVVLLLLLGPPLAEDEQLHLTPDTFQALQDASTLTEMYRPGTHWGAHTFEVRNCQARLRWVWDAPPVADALRLPLAHDISAALEFNAAYRAWWAKWKYRYQEALDAEQETAQHRGPYELMQTARNESNDWATRKRALKELRDHWLVGARAYYAGDWPPPVPLHRFNTIE